MKIQFRHLCIQIGLIFLATSCSTEEGSDNLEGETAKSSTDAEAEVADQEFPTAETVQPYQLDPGFFEKLPEPLRSHIAELYRLLIDPEYGESTNCKNHKEAIANQNIFFDNESGLEVRFVNQKMSFKEAEKVCADSSPVVTLRPATEEELEALAHLFVADNSEQCVTDVWSFRKIFRHKIGTAYRMPDVRKELARTDAKVLCVVE
jgi:hypothetical protein